MLPLDRSTSTSTNGCYDLLGASTRTRSRRVLIDSLTDLQFAAPDEMRFREYMYSLVQRFSRQGVSLFMTSELPNLFEVTRLSEYGVSHLSDNVVLLQYIRDGSTVRRALTVLKTRASRHEPEIREFRITPEGIVLGEPISTRRCPISTNPATSRPTDEDALAGASCSSNGSTGTCRSASSSSTPGRSSSCTPTPGYSTSSTRGSRRRAGAIAHTTSTTRSFAPLNSPRRSRK